MSAADPTPPAPQLGSRAGWFEDLRPFAYLNHAAVSPLPTAREPYPQTAARIRAASQNGRSSAK